MTKKATIASLSEKVDQMMTAVNYRVSALRGMMGSALGLSHGGKRDIYEIYGYPSSLGGDQGFRLMYLYSRRQGIANRITAGIAKPCWRDRYRVYDSPDDDADEVLADEMLALKKVGAIKKLEAADTLNRIGRFSILYVGVPDGRTPDQPLGTVTNGQNRLNQLYFSAYAYDGVNIDSTDNDVNSPRYGLPLYYNLSIVDYDKEKDPQTKNICAPWFPYLQYHL